MFDRRFGVIASCMLIGIICLVMISVDSEAAGGSFGGGDGSAGNPYIIEDVDDLQAGDLARRIARKLEEDLQYPGQIEVTVIREYRAHDYAR